jgi:hypothetical protein
VPGPDSEIGPPGAVLAEGSEEEEPLPTVDVEPLTVSVAALVCAEPAVLVKTARYSPPLSLAVVVNERVFAVAPET